MSVPRILKHSDGREMTIFANGKGNLTQEETDRFIEAIESSSQRAFEDSEVSESEGEQ